MTVKVRGKCQLEELSNTNMWFFVIAILVGKIIGGTFNVHVNLKYNKTSQTIPAGHFYELCFIPATLLSYLGNFCGTDGVINYLVVPMQLDCLK